ncbi:hypothetical protein DVV91_12335 [Clostridium botulinum]|uniref:hypothetical protein n=1 Tax=Clostridium botulinum TaxID=1491 RepID=UPI000174E6DE|nr:hypothetical protein [Clostridium botulinum]ACD51429.1 hypothetical protein CLH_2477 [Clostridium botulinum E3 str. Alaska E43]AJF30323.1 hypothetical protein ST13_11665 [Clostridium botulinum]AJF33386.1 hypothetical protein ST12_11665 [Clostridium botulinum]MBN1049406.1 hypothetical protein [Clostridium botulinum]MBN1075127.1 hypothetical protein [Clostridium botulinum]
MAFIMNKGKYIDLESGFFKGRITGFERTGKKVVKTQVFEQGYLYVTLEDGTIVKQYLLLAPWRSFLYFKLLKAIKENFNIKDECNEFNKSLINKEVVIEIEENFDGHYSYKNINNIYSIEEGIYIIQAENNKISEIQDDEISNYQ